MTNFLPWRQQRKQRCGRFWALLIVGSLMISLAAMISLRSLYSVKAQALQARLKGDTAILHQLESHRAQWRAQHEQQLTQQAESARVKSHAWQPALVSLASSMPEQAWLTQMSYQHSSLELTGYTATFSALSTLAESLKKVPGFVLGPAGEMQQESQGRWMFSFRLQSQG